MMALKRLMCKNQPKQFRDFDVEFLPSVRRSNILTRERLDSNPESVKLTQVAIDLLPMQPCTVCLGVKCGDRLR